jgi:hypothetical protein
MIFTGLDYNAFGSPKKTPEKALPFLEQASRLSGQNIDEFICSMLKRQSLI